MQAGRMNRRRSHRPPVLTTLRLWVQPGRWRCKAHSLGSELLIVAPARDESARRCLLAVARAAAAEGRHVIVLSV